MNSKTPKRIVTVVEGRAGNQQVVEDIMKSAESRGWGFQYLGAVNSDRLARYDLSEMSLDYVVFRELTGNDYSEAERLLLYLKKNDKVIINGNPAGARASTSDKHFQQGLFLLDPVLKDYALPTFMAKKESNVLSYIKGKRVHFPIVLKHRFGTTGKKIDLIKDEKALSKVVDYDGYLIEQYIEPECDWRVFVVGGTAVGVMRKKGDPKNPGNFRLWSGGFERNLEEDPDTIEILSKIACRAAAVSKLEYTGVDIIRDAKTKKYYLLETNFAAGWLNFIPITHINIPDYIIDWLEDRGDAKTETTKDSIKKYIDKRRQFLARETRDNYDKILAGEKGIIEKVKEDFKYEPAKYLCDTGTIFKKLSKAYIDLTESKDPDPKKYKTLIEEIDEMPLSWAGNFIGPETGTLDEGAILTALYLFILGKIDKV